VKKRKCSKTTTVAEGLEKGKFKIRTMTGNGVLEKEIYETGPVYF